MPPLLLLLAQFRQAEAQLAEQVMGLEKGDRQTPPPRLGQSQWKKIDA